jgi:predicted 3-demethylubiquinone-9 3-methyltransferase (glyoxalase superfamily)
MTRSASTFLMFEGSAEDAMRLYESTFGDASITSLERYAAGEPGTEGQVKRGTMTLSGHDLTFFDSYVKHGFTFTPSISIFVECESEEELEHAYNALLEGGQALMPLDNYGFSRRFGWVNDRYGVSWQLNWQ